MKNRASVIRELTRPGPKVERSAEMKQETSDTVKFTMFYIDVYVLTAHQDVHSSDIVEVYNILDDGVNAYMDQCHCFSSLDREPIERILEANGTCYGFSSGIRKVQLSKCSVAIKRG